MNDWIAETLNRPPLRVDDAVTPELLKEELTERLEALLASHNGLEPTAEGWRALALALALKHEPAFRIETPVDREGRSGAAGPKVGFWNFIRRSQGKALVEKYRSEQHPESKLRGLAASALARKDERERRNSDPDWKRPEALVRNNAYALLGSKEAYRNRYNMPDILRREPYVRVAEKALRLAAWNIMQRSYPPKANETDA